MTWYPQAFVDISMADMHMHANVSTGFPGRSYRFYTGQTVYGFGHGLSYSVFQYMFRDSTKTVHFSTHKEMQFDQFGRLGLSSRGQESSSKTQLFCIEMGFEVGIVVKTCGPRDGATVFCAALLCRRRSVEAADSFQTCLFESRVCVGGDLYY